MMKFAIYSAITDNGRIDNNSIDNYSSIISLYFAFLIASLAGATR